MKRLLISKTLYLKNKNHTRRIKAITINEAQKVVEEIERLNNIINELEEYICAIEYDERHSDSWQIPVRIHNKLKELKGNESNE